MTPLDYLNAARVPLSLAPQSFGPWTIERVFAPHGARPTLVDNDAGGDDWVDPADLFVKMIGWDSQTLLRHDLPPVDDPFAAEVACAHAVLARRDVVMEDSRHELSTHLPIWLAAHGRVLVTGLGLGCVVRGLLANPRVDHVDVVEIDPDIVRVVGAEFAANPRVTLHLGDALTFEGPPDARWDFAWHDLWTDGDVHLQRLHGQLLVRFHTRCPQQGAWRLPRVVKRNLRGMIIG